MEFPMSTRISPTRALAASAALLVTGSTLALAQEGAPTPAPELQNYAPWVGEWHGKGTARMNVEDPEMAWTSTNVYAWILGGHVLQETTEIRFPEYDIPSMQFMTFFCYDAQTKEHRSFGVENSGGATISTVHWIDGVVTSTNQGVENGAPFTDHWITQMKKGAIEFTGHRMLGSGAPYTHVQGTMVRVDADDSKSTPKAKPAEAGMTKPSAPMLRLAKMAGNYRLDGSMVPLPGMPALPITARTEVKLLFGGTVCEMRDFGDPIDGVPGPNYEGVHYMCWDANKQLYTHFGLNNMGEGGEAPAVWIDNTLVFTTSQPLRGIPAAYRTMMRVNDEGQLIESLGDMLGGTSDAETVFKAKYTPAKS